MQPCRLAARDLACRRGERVLFAGLSFELAPGAAVQLAGPGGHVAFIGIPVPDVKLSNATFQYFLRQEISLHGSWNSFSAPFPGPQWTTTLEKFGTGELKWEFMISHDLDLAELPGIFERFDKKDLHFSKVLFRP